MLRRPAVSGQFYYGSAPRLEQQVSQYLGNGIVREKAVGIMVPHAGLVYSGPVAGAVYSSIQMPKTFVMIGPNHTGLGARIAVMDEGEWEIPTGKLRIDRKLAGRILLNTERAERDPKAHTFEHSLEVQLPFIVHFSQETEIVPIAMLSATYDQCAELAEGISKAIQSVDYPVTILASSDMSHYVPDRIARQKDKAALDHLLSLDPRGLYDTVVRERISMCGYLPATVMLIASGMLGARTARIIRYMTSGEVSDDYESVVGYAGVVITV
ncbi:MAG TPA: AmmeMemoRadiSam system protein B [Thermodesulfovibrionales bacterium]|nr:AmmeMemoRadiSam system protein B [Thermodesulfovibrionales bacterium]